MPGYHYISGRAVAFVSLGPVFTTHCSGQARLHGDVRETRLRRIGGC